MPVLLYLAGEQPAALARALEVLLVGGLQGVRARGDEGAARPPLDGQLPPLLLGHVIELHLWRWDRGAG